MIQEPLMTMLKAVIPELTWTVDYRTQNDNTGTVYSTGGSSSLPATDVEYRYPTYQVYLRSSDWDFVKTASEIVFQTLHKKRNFVVEVNYYKDNEIIATIPYYVHLITAMSDPIRLGEDGGIMEYSVNFDVVLTEIKEVIN